MVPEDTAPGTARLFSPVEMPGVASWEGGPGLAAAPPTDPRAQRQPRALEPGVNTGRKPCHVGWSWQAGRRGLPCKTSGKLVMGKSLLIFFQER